uniref:Uncharacterized protein n=1 Tax=candidate division WOR-3 bacterium TaxID=2052148 RepID=A0A7C1SRM2_UNCW3
MEGLTGVLKELVRRSQQVVKRLDGYQALLREPVANAYERARLLAEIERLAAGFPEGELRQKLLEWLNSERAQVEEAKSEFRFEFGKRLIAGLEGSGLAVRGQLPLLRIGFFAIRADFERGRATVFWGPEIEQLKSGVPLEPLGLARLVRSYQESLKVKGIREPEEFLARLLSAYRRRCGAEGLAEGERVLLSDLLAELVLLSQPESFRSDPVRENFVEYPRIRFSYDLYLLKRSGVRAVAGQELRLTVANFDATAKKSRALWVPDSEEGDGTYYSYISFVPVRSTGE